MKILIVDDNPADYNLFKRTLVKGFSESDEVNCFHVEDPQDVKNALSEQQFDCIILDYLLGIITGLEVLAEIRSVDKTIPIIMLTGKGDETVAVEALQSGASDYLVKNDVTPSSAARAVNKAIEKKDLELKFLDKKRELEDFAYTAAHDLKAPLAIINQTGQLINMLLAKNPNPEIKEQADVLVEVSMQMSKFVTELLNYAKTGRSQKELVSLSVDKQLAKAVSNLETITKNLGGSINIESTFGEIKGDSTAIMQLFQNLISNGLKFSRPGEKPIVSIRNEALKSSQSKKWRIKIVIEDNGAGIPADKVKAVFSPLVRLHTHEDVEGSGLGLAITKKIVSQHSGKIWIESMVGEGTKVYILL